jgi:hypothetical protein
MLEEETAFFSSCSKRVTGRRGKNGDFKFAKGPGKVSGPCPYPDSIPAGQNVTTMTFWIEPEPMNHGPAFCETTFYEVQRFRQVWLWILLAGLAALAWYIFIMQVPSPSPVAIIIVFVFGTVFPFWFLVMKLEVRVDGDLLSYRMYPLQIRWKKIPVGDIAIARAVVYRPILNYTGGGYGSARRGGLTTYQETGECALCGRTGSAFSLDRSDPVNWLWCSSPGSFRDRN